MQHNQQYFPEKLVVPLPDQVSGCNIHNASIPSVFGGTVLDPDPKYSRPVCGVQVKPSEVCPRNFIIFDYTDNRSQIMFHPENATKFPYPGLNNGMTYFQHCTAVVGVNGNDIEREISPFAKEDSDDIDALLSFDDEEQEEFDEEEVSTGRTRANFGCESPDSCSNYSKKARKSWLPSSWDKSSCSHSRSSSSSSGKKRQKIRKMVKALKAIVPGANRMSTIAALDEAVRYLKSLKVEVQKIGLGNLKD